MLHLLLTLVLFVAVMGMAAVLFSGWVVVNLVRGIGRLVLPRPAVFRSEMGNARVCGNERCRVFHPLPSRFCRRCGRALSIPSNATRELMPLRPLHAVQ